MRARAWVRARQDEGHSAGAEYRVANHEVLIKHQGDRSQEQGKSCRQPELTDPGMLSR
jgi:hypothetical protein